MRGESDRMSPVDDQVDAPGMRLMGITTVLDDSPVLHRLMLDVPAGEITVLMGPSGAGKTTLVRHLVGLLEPDRGTVEIGGRDVWEADPAGLREIRNGMGVLLGGSSLFDSSLFASMTAFENLEYSLKHHRVGEAERRRRAMARLEELALGDVAEQRPEAMPAHARRRLGLARALVTDAPALILDDIDVCLDAAHSHRILAALANWRERTHGTLLITTHKIGLARELGDHLAILCNGRIITTGSAAELLNGIETNEQFDHRFQISDFLGPPRMEDIEADDETSRGGVKLRLTIDPAMVRAAIIGVVVVTLVIMTLALAHVL
ncbi:ATP-binding cassette domain-containing protein [Actinomycetospora endophytica]|uniref:ATP-binding cassette domain-containing protein n=1 Tax=Actinomycetospora endophytica TaxID=2291215 RepID=A0ABS8P668_9PSEU|nr:ATP-binding cassette domain-containing protein [Actinomycetospora endophytica]MCD2193757.1 ATP-binding cassette domain-containing protein [Actinomycetospora endophytica]